MTIGTDFQIMFSYESHGRVYRCVKGPRGYLMQMKRKGAGTFSSYRWSITEAEYEMYRQRADQANADALLNKKGTPNLFPDDDGPGAA